MTDTLPGATASVDLTRILLKYASTDALDIREICDEIRLDPLVLENAGARIPIEQFNAIWEEIVSRTRDRNFGLHFGEAAHHFLTGHVLFSVMMNCATVGEALEKFFRYHSLMADVVRPEMTPKNDVVHIGLKTVHPRVRLYRHHAEYILALMTAVLRQLTENKMRIIRVSFEHPQPADVSEHQRIFQSSLFFEKPENALVFNGDCLEFPVFTADQELLDTVEQYAQKLLNRLYPRDVWGDRVNKQIGKILLRGETPRIETIARNLALGTRSLQSKLKEEGTTYQKLLDTVRKELAMDYLKNSDMTLFEVAFLLGFSDQSAFNHAFRRWTGSSPMKYRA